MLRKQASEMALGEHDKKSENARDMKPASIAGPISSNRTASFKNETRSKQTFSMDRPRTACRLGLKTL